MISNPLIEHYMALKEEVGFISRHIWTPLDLQAFFGTEKRMNADNYTAS